MTSFLFINPAVMLSGFGFPIENMPQWVQYLTYLNPLRYFVAVIRGVYLKGVGLDIPLASTAGYGRDRHIHDRHKRFTI